MSPDGLGGPQSSSSEAFAAIIVAGGAGTRLSGVSKPGLVIAGRRLLDRTLEACEGASSVVIVGGPHLKRDDALWACEEPPGSGPAAGLQAGLAALDAARDASPLVLVLGADTPRAHAAVAALLAHARAGVGAQSGADGAWIVDEEGFPQPLMAVYRRENLAAQCAALASPGVSLRRVTARLDMAAVPDVDGASRDVDTWEDVQYWEGELS